MNKEVLKKILRDQQEISFSEDMIARQEEAVFDAYRDDTAIMVISGIRRCGKSVLLRRIRSSFSQNHFFCNFDDDRLATFALSDFQTLYEAFLEMYGEEDVFFFDEIQNVPEWERFVRRLHDMGKKVYLTSSNASLLSSELGTRLTGRNLAFSLYPFSFSEFLAFRRITFPSAAGGVLSTVEQANIARSFHEYLQLGGMPEFLHTEKKSI